MMAGWPRLPISTFGAITTRKVSPGIFRAVTRFRDWDGQTRKVTSTGSSPNAAQAVLKADLAARLRGGNSGDALTASSPFVLLAEAWMEDVMLDVDRSQGAKDTYQRALLVLVAPFFENFTIRDVTVGPIELFLRQ